MVRADLHNHLRGDMGTQESRLTFNRVIDFASKRLGPGGIFGLVNMNGKDTIDRRYEQFIKSREAQGYEGLNFGNAICVPNKEILVIKAQEVRTNKGHLLCLGVRENRSLRSGANVSLDDALKEADDNNCVKIVDHPFYLEGMGSFLSQNPEYLEKIDGFEVHNGEAALWIPFMKNTYNANEKAREFFDSEIRDKHNVGAVYSSDGHSLGELGSSWMEILMPDISNSEKLISSLREEIRQIPENYQAKNSVIPAFMHAAKMAINFYKR